MPNRSSNPPNRPRDANKLAKAVVDEATGDVTVAVEPMKNPAAVELGRSGGLKGGVARAASLSAERRSEIARHAAQARWKNNGKGDSHEHTD